MEILSLVIMAVGILALVVIYWLSQRSRKHLYKGKNLPPISKINDEEGIETSSVLQDQPARDGKEPVENAQTVADVTNPQFGKDTANTLPKQLVMFIAAEEGETFSGTEVLSALERSGLTFGEMDVFHRIVLTDDGESSLFNVANGVAPWTLIPDELRVSDTPGLSMILKLPSPIDNREALHDFVRTAERIAGYLNGVLKNQDQRPITAEERRSYFSL